MTEPGALHRSREIAVVESADRAVLVHLDHPERPARILEGSAAAVWAAIDGGRDAAAVTAFVAAEYGVAPEDIAHDVARLLAGLGADDLVQLEDHP